MVYLITLKDEQISGVINMQATCNISRIKSKNNILIIKDVTINEEGVINEHQFSLDEVLMSGKFKLVISKEKQEKLVEICNYYNIPLLELI